MDTKLLEDRIRDIEGHISLGERHIGRRRRIVHETAGDPEESGRAQNLLETFEVVQAGHIATRNRLMK